MMYSHGEDFVAAETGVSAGLESLGLVAVVIGHLRYQHLVENNVETGSLENTS